MSEYSQGFLSGFNGMVPQGKSWVHPADTGQSSPELKAQLSSQRSSYR
jgi:hypothetical protein